MDGEALIEALRRADIPSSPIFSIADIFADPHYASRGNLVALEHPQLGEFKMPGVAPRLSSTPGEIEWLGRGLGEDTAAVLSGALGYSRERIDTLRQRGVV